jgi:hypothetical protein
VREVQASNDIAVGVPMPGRGREHSSPELVSAVRRNASLPSMEIGPNTPNPTPKPSGSGPKK